MIPQQALINDALSSHTPPPFPADADPTVTATDIISLADLQPQPVEWLWQHRLAAGTLAMLSGKPGSGKTWVALAIAAALTRGRDPFTAEELKPATVLYVSAEHPAAQVIHPRFAGLKGNPARLVILRRAVSASSTPSPDSALRALEHALQKTQPDLVILDPWDELCEADLDGRKHALSIVSPAWRSFTTAAFSSFATSPNLPPAGLPTEVGHPSTTPPPSAPGFSSAARPTHPRNPLCCTSNRTLGPWLRRSTTGLEKPAISTGRGSATSPRRTSSPPVPPAPGCPSASLPPNGCATACNLAGRPRALSR